MSTTLKNITLVGAAGSLGSVVLQKLIASGKFNIRVLRRTGSTSAVPAGAETVDADFESLDSLTAALSGQDALISTVGTSGFDSQQLLVDAAIKAGVKRILPSEFGSNLENPYTRKLPVFASKVKVQDYIIEKSKSSDLTYTFVFNSAFLDWGIQYQFIIATASPNPPFFNGGDLPFSTTSLSSIGDAVVGILNHPGETKNRAVRIHDIIITQKELLDLAKQAAPEKSWEPVTVSIDDITAKADARLAQGLYDFETFGPYLTRAVFDPANGGKFEQTDNELLGVKGKNKEDIVEIFKAHFAASA